jgi:hypothetical protein
MSALLHTHLVLLGSLTLFLHLCFHLAALPLEVHAYTLLLLTNAVNPFALLAIIDGHRELSVLGHKLPLGKAFLLPLALLLLRVDEALVFELKQLSGVILRALQFL